MPSATESRDLHTGATVWEAYGSDPLPEHGLKQSRRADLVVVGAGITGALIAEAATAIGLQTVILDRRRPSRGSTAASTALLQFEIDTPLLRLVDEVGFQRASRAWSRSLEAVCGLRALVGRLQIACAFRDREAIYLAGNTLRAHELAEEARLRQSIGLPSQFVDRADLLLRCGIRREAAVISQGAADVNPVQLTHGLLRVALQRGAKLCFPVQLAEVAASGQRVGIATDDGVEIETEALVFATGYELAKGVPTDGHRRSSTWAFATRPQPEALRVAGASVIWEASDPYLYLRSTSDGRLVVGGEDEELEDAEQRDALTKEKIPALQLKTKALLPWLDTEADYAWAGTFGESETGLPTIGPVPGMPNCYAVLGYGGNGITFGFLAAQLMSGFLSGNPDPDAVHFAFKR